MRLALTLALVVACLGACSKKKGGDEALERASELLVFAPQWNTITGDGWSLEVPGQARVDDGADDAGTTTTVYEVRLLDGVYALAHARSPLLDATQNRKLIAEAADTEIYKRLGATLVSEQSLKVEAGQPGLTWPARDLVLKVGKDTCAARDLFAADHYFFLAACRPTADVTGESWLRMRDSLRLVIDPVQGVAAVDSSSWAAWSPDGKATLRQRTAQSGKCLLVCARDNVEAWRAEVECRGSAKDSHFVADDCERSVLFYGEPVRGGSLLAVKVLSVYARERLDYDVVGAAVVKKTDTMKRFSHLVQGLGGNSGEKPRYTEDAKSVAFVTVENRKQLVPLAAKKRAEVSSPDAVLEPAPELEPVKAPAKPPGKKRHR